jgi:hypothetical protein
VTRFWLLLVVVAILVGSAQARADEKSETAARALQKKAIEDDYLVSEFGRAQEKLERAIAQCAGDRCSATLRARLRRDLGVVQIGGGIDKERGINNFVEAMRLDSSITLDPDLRTKDLDAAFAEAKKRYARTSGVLYGTGAQPQGDFQHTPVPEQQVRTAVPVYVEYAGPETITRVVVKYRGFGMAEWKSVTLDKTDKGWGGLLPCADMQVGGALYYLQGINPNNDVVASGGDRNSPYRVPIKADKVAQPPHLPGAAPPTQCADTGDCPPSFPGCKRAAEPLREVGEACDEDSECKSNRCDISKCGDANPNAGKKKIRPKLWIGLAGSVDYTFVPGTDDACKLTDETFPRNDKNYYCTREDGTDYPSRDEATFKAENDSIILTKDRGSDKVTGGGAFGNVRPMLTVDYALTANLLLGARLGVVLNTYSGLAAGQDGNRFTLPIHAEARATYFFGHDALYRDDFVPYVFGGLGAARFETRIPAQTIERKPGAAPVAHNVDAWHLAGPAFVSVGGGARWLVSPNFALTFGVRGSLAFLHAFAPSIGPEIGGQLGL